MNKFSAFNCSKSSLPPSFLSGGREQRVQRTRGKVSCPKSCAAAAAQCSLLTSIQAIGRGASGASQLSVLLTFCGSDVALGGPDVLFLVLTQDKSLIIFFLIACDLRKLAAVSYSF